LFGQSGIYDRVGTIPGHDAFGSLPEENIDLFTGNVTLSYRDIYLPGPNGLDVEVWRVYNSKILKDRQSGNPVVQAYHQSWVGMGWTMHMGMVHNFSSSAPVIEFPDGRLETAYPNNYGLGTNIYLSRDFLKYDKTYAPPFVYPKLYFKNGVIWTFGASATITRADGTSDPVRLVTKIENAYGHHIDIVYDPGLPTIQTITDSTDRVVTFVTSGTPKKLAQIKVKDSQGDDRVFSYSVGNYANGYHRLDSFTPPMLPATTFEYLDGSSSRYELVRMTTSYGGILEYSYVNHTFYFNTILLDSRVMSQKRIIFNPGEQAATWNFTYPTYQGVTTGTVQVQGPAYNTSVTYNSYSSITPWKIGLVTVQQAVDGSYSDTYDWAYQQISNTIWTVLGINMGTAKGPLVSSVIESRVGDATSRTEYLYERAATNRYGLPTRINSYIDTAGPLKSSTYLIYYFEAHTGFRDRNMLDFVSQEEIASSQSSLMRKTITTYYEETGKWGALKQVKCWKGGSPDFTWDYEYSSDFPSLVTIKVDPPGYSDKETIGYNYGVKNSASLPDFTRLTRTINLHDSSVYNEKRQDEGEYIYSYDNLGRVTAVDLGGYYTDIAYAWRPNGENKVAISQGSNIVTKYWDGMGRDTGAIETGDSLTLYSRRTLDAEGRVIAESKASVNPAHVYSYVYDAAGRVTRTTDPITEFTTVAYSGITKTVTDAENHATVYEYGDLPGLPTRVTDALNHSALYTYDAVGRLTNVDFNGTRHHNYAYDGVDNVLSENHPETGLISYAYNNENLLSSKTWGGSTLRFEHDKSRRLVRTTATTGGPIDTVDYSYNIITGRVQSIVDITTGWSRENLVYNPWGLLTSETVTIPGLAPKTIAYTYDWSNNPTGSLGTTITTNGLNMPETLSFNRNGTPELLISEVSYGPNKMPTTMTIARNNTAYSAAYNNAGMLSSAALQGGGTTLYNASYTYDGVGNILSITSTAPALGATFGYDSLNRLTSAAYSSGRAGTYAYQYDEYGNMLTVRENGALVFDKTYGSANRINGYNYDNRGNITSSGGNLYYWDAQNRLQFIQNTAGEVLGKYLYDDRGLRLMAVPPLPEINVRHEAVDIPDGGDAFLSIPPGQSINETLTVENLGDANLMINNLTITGDNAADFGIVAQPASPVSPLGNTTFVIQFHPQTAGYKTALLTIPNNDVNESPYHINLYGNYEPEINILQAPDGGSFNFGVLEIGNYSQPTFTIQNLGDKDLLLYGEPIVVIAGADADQFEVISQPNTIYDPLPLQIGPGLSRTFVIRFSPTSEGLKTAAISIVNNDWNENPYDITLLGTGELGGNKIREDTAFVVTSPVEGEKLVPGAVHLNTWTGAEDVKDVKIEYSTNNGSTYLTIVERTPNVGSYPWLVPPVISGICLFRVTSADGAAATALSFSYEFKLKVPSAGSTTVDAPTLSVCASVPDTRTRNSWTADIAFSANKFRADETMAFNFVEADCGTLDEFLDKWHQVRVQLKLDTYTGSVWVDGRLVLDGVPLRQTPDAALIPELMITCGAAKSAGVRVEDIEVKYRDQILKPKNEGEEVSQSIVSDSFETYRAGVFPRTGGWLTGVEKILGASSEIRPGGTPADALSGRPADSLKDKGKRFGNAKTEAEGEIRGSEVLQSGGQGAQASGYSDGASENGAALIDEEDSVSGLRSFRLETVGIGSISVVKRFSLPDRVPFGVSAGSFAIGVKPEDSQRRAGLRELLDRESRLERRSGKLGKENDPETGPTSGVKNERNLPADSRSADTALDQGSAGSGKTMKTLSASPVGNYYLYSFDGKLLQTYNVYGVLLKDYIYMGDRLIAEYDHVGSRYLFYTPDQINSTRVVTDDAGTVVYSAAHDPYGGIQQTWVNTFDPTPKFSGKERDAESGLDYFGARYYSNPIYRWLSADSIKSKPGAISDPQRWNLYSYCGNNPLVYIDPDGSDQINIFLGFDRWDLKLDFSNLQETAKYAGHHITVYPFGSYDKEKFEESVKAKDTWTFFIGHSTPKDKKTGKRFGITIGVDSTWLTDFIISNNDCVGIFSCNSSDFAFDLFVAGTVFATTESLRNSSLGLEAGAYFLLDLLLQGEDPTTLIGLAQGFWAWTLGAAGPVEPAIVTEKKK
jgi:RHS repeat-associated protein